MSIENTHVGAVGISRALAHCKSIFFIGIGGISMAALAELSHARGFSVGGSDRTATALTDSLEQKGIRVFYGHRAEQVAGYDAVVYTVAIGEDNPEYLAAMQAGKPLFSRSDYLGYLMTDFSCRIGISGMHGKSTCTAMCADILLAAADPTVLCGARLPSLGNSPCRIGTEREHILFEACEYMDSFLDFNPTLAVILNVSMDHVDYFHSMEQIRTSFLHFAERTEQTPCGAVLYNADDKEVLRSLESFGGKRVGFGIACDAEFTAKGIDACGGMIEFDFLRHGELLCHLRVQASGRHNVYNALAAASVATLCGIAPKEICEGLANFRGASRRMEKRGALPSGAVVYDDYGHHPDEIRATLSGVRTMGYRRILCAYQPHTYSRTAGLMQEFSQAFSDADRVYLADIFAAREENVYGVSSAQLAERVGERAEYCGSFEAVAEAISRDAREGDVVVVMGAGDVYCVFDMLELR